MTCSVLPYGQPCHWVLGGFLWMLFQSWLIKPSARSSLFLHLPVWLRGCSRELWGDNGVWWKVSGWNISGRQNPLPPCTGQWHEGEINTVLSHWDSQGSFYNNFPTLTMEIDLEQLSHLPKVMQLSRTRAEIKLKDKLQTWVCRRMWSEILGNFFKIQILQLDSKNAASVVLGGEGSRGACKSIFTSSLGNVS